VLIVSRGPLGGYDRPEQVGLSRSRPCKVRSRRILVIAAFPDKGPFTDRKAAALTLRAATAPHARRPALSCSAPSAKMGGARKFAPHPLFDHLISAGED
jgi:hypothetical protein